MTEPTDTVTLPTQAPRRLPLWLLALALLGGAVINLLVPHYLNLGQRAVAQPYSSDFYKFYLSAQRVQQGLSPYWLVPPGPRPDTTCPSDTPAGQALPSPHPARLTLGGERPCLHPNLNPPAFMALALPLARLPYAQAWWTWAAVSVACGLLSLWLLVSAVVRPWAHRLAWTVVACAALMLTFPNQANFSLGQVGLMMLLGLTLAWRLGRSGQDGWAGVCLGLTMGLKPFLLVMVLPYVMAGRWRLLGNTTATVAATLACGALLCGWVSHLDYVHMVAQVDWYASDWNASWMGLSERTLNFEPIADAHAIRLARHGLAWLCGAITVAGYLMRCRRWALDGNPMDNAVALLGPATALLVSPLGWMYYFPILLLAMPVLVPARTGARRSIMHLLAIGVIGLALCVPVAQMVDPASQVWPPSRGMVAWFNGLLLGLLLILAISMGGHLSKSKLPSPTSRPDLAKP